MFGQWFCCFRCVLEFFFVFFCFFLCKVCVVVTCPHLTPVIQNIAGNGPSLQESLSRITSPTVSSSKIWVKPKKLTSEETYAKKKKNTMWALTWSRTTAFRLWLRRYNHPWKRARLYQHCKYWSPGSLFHVWQVKASAKVVGKRKTSYFLYQGCNQWLFFMIDCSESYVINIPPSLSGHIFKCPLTLQWV